MNKKIFIEYDNNLLEELSKNLRNYFINDNYNVTILDNSLSTSEKKYILNNNTSYFLLSNKINSIQNTIEIIYPLNSNDNLARSVFNYLENKTNITKYYQLRSSANTALDYYEILRNVNNDSIIIRYGINTLNNMDLANDIYLAITNYLKEENIYTVKSGDSLYVIAKRFNTTVDEIKRVNNLSSNNLSIGQKLIIPSTQNNNENINNNIYVVQSGDSLYAIAKRFNTSVDGIKRLNNLSSNSLSIGQQLILPGTQNNNENMNNNIYVVQSGDSLYGIAKRFNTSVDGIKRLNNLSSNSLSIGQKLIISSTQNDNENMNNNIYVVQSGDSLYAIAKRFNTSVDEIKRLNNLSSNNLSIGQKLIIPSSQNNNQSSNLYTVQSGDSLYAIAKRFNTTVDEIKRLNNLSSNNLSIGQKLIIK